MLLRRIARPLLAAVFVVEGVRTLQEPGPLAEALEPVLGRGGDTNGTSETAARAIAAAEIGSGAMLAFGKAPRAAATTLAAITAVGLGAHPFWTEIDPDLKQIELGEFVNGLGRLGAILIAAADTEGRPSLGWRSRHAAETVRDKAESVRDRAAALGSHG